MCSSDLEVRPVLLRLAILKFSTRPEYELLCSITGKRSPIPVAILLTKLVLAHVLLPHCGSIVLYGSSNLSCIVTRDAHSNADHPVYLRIVQRSAETPRDVLVVEPVRRIGV